MLPEATALFSTMGEPLARMTIDSLLKVIVKSTNFRALLSVRTNEQAAVNYFGGRNMRRKTRGWCNRMWCTVRCWKLRWANMKPVPITFFSFFVSLFQHLQCSSNTHYTLSSKRYRSLTEITTYLTILLRCRLRVRSARTYRRMGSPLLLSMYQSQRSLQEKRKLSMA